MSDGGFWCHANYIAVWNEISPTHRFDFLARHHWQAATVNACYELGADRKLVIQYREVQHTKSVPFFDKQLTTSACSRAE